MTHPTLPTIPWNISTHPSHHLWNIYGRNIPGFHGLDSPMCIFFCKICNFYSQSCQWDSCTQTMMWTMTMTHVGQSMIAQAHYQMSQRNLNFCWTKVHFVEPLPLFWILCDPWVSKPAQFSCLYSRLHAVNRIMSGVTPAYSTNRVYTV